MENRQVRVAYIGGDGRSGSTLCEQILGQIEGAVAVGELRHIWEKSFARDEMCSCGQPFSRCEFWRAVLADAFGGYETVPLDHIVALKQSVDRIRFLPRLVLPGKGRFGQQLAEYGQIMQTLYGSIHTISGADLIIDASKDPSTAYLLRKWRGVHLSIIHLVRDSRAVGYSWQRKKVRPEVVHQTQYMATYSPRQAAFMWMVRNSLIQGLKVASVPYIRVRYEDLVEDPQAEIGRIARVIGLPGGRYDFIHGREIDIQPGHTVAGNPSRFRHGRVPLKLDADWVSQLSRRDKRIITWLTAPLLHHYQYPLHPQP